MYLVDTNVWLEALLDQERSQDVRLFLTAVPSSDLHITDFAFHSIGLVLSRLHRPDTFLRFVEDLFVDGSTTLIHLTPEEMRRSLRPWSASPSTSMMPISILPLKHISSLW